VIDYNRFLYARGNPVKHTDPRGFGQPIDLNNSDVNAFVVSDRLSGVAAWGNRIKEIRKMQNQILSRLKQRSEFNGLRERGFGFRIFSTEEAQRQFRGEELYFIGDE